MTLTKRRYFLPFPHPIETDEVADGASGEKSYIFDADYTIYSIHSAVRGIGSPHTDFRMKLSYGSTKSYFCNKAFSARALTLDNGGFDFMRELGDFLYVKKGDRLIIEAYNDSGAAITPSLQLQGVRGWINNNSEPIGRNQRTDKPQKMNIPRTLDQMIPFVWVVEPGATIANGATTDWIETKINCEATILRMNYAVRGTAEGSSPDDLRAEIIMPGGQGQQQKEQTFSLKGLTRDNAGMRFIDVFGYPLRLDKDDRINVKFHNDTGGNAWASLILIGLPYCLPDAQELELIKLLKS